METSTEYLGLVRLDTKVVLSEMIKWLQKLLLVKGTVTVPAKCLGHCFSREHFCSLRDRSAYAYWHLLGFSGFFIRVIRDAYCAVLGNNHSDLQHFLHLFVQLDIWFFWSIWLFNYLLECCLRLSAVLNRCNCMSLWKEQPDLNKLYDSWGLMSLQV